MQDKYCLPIMKPDSAEVLSTIEQHVADYGSFEIWLDYLSSPTVEFIRQLTGQYPGKLVFVFRRLELEPIRMPVDTRLELLRALDGVNCLVDLDIASQTAELELVATANLRLNIIASYHNYHETPRNAELTQTVEGLTAAHPAIVKVATMCRNEDDAVRLLQLQLKFRHQGQKHIVLGMGAHGTVTRIFGPLWGNELIFAPVVAAESSAPGELTRQQLEAALAAIQS